MVDALPQVVAALQGGSILPAAEGIVTTDLYPKVRRAAVGGGSIVGIAKGAGMIEPNMATMLVYLLTDIAVPRDDRCARSSRRAVDASFNTISVDSDTSTSDTVAAAFVAAGAVRGPGRLRARADDGLPRSRGGRGAQRRGRAPRHPRVGPAGPDRTWPARWARRSSMPRCSSAPWRATTPTSAGSCRRSASTSARGARHRFVAAAAAHGRHRDIFAAACSSSNPTKEKAAGRAPARRRALRQRPAQGRRASRRPSTFPPHERCVEIGVDLGCGTASATVLGGDLTHEYVSENADYRS